MSSDLQLIKRTIAAVQGSDLPRDVARFLEDGFTQYLYTPGVTLDDSFGLQGRIGKRRIWFEVAKQSRAEFLQRHYEQCHATKTKHAASKVIADNLARLKMESSRTVAPEYVELYDALVKLPLKTPTTQARVYEYLRLPLKDVL